MFWFLLSTFAEDQHSHKKPKSQSAHDDLPAGSAVPISPPNIDEGTG